MEGTFQVRLKIFFLSMLFIIFFTSPVITQTGDQTRVVYNFSRDLDYFRNKTPEEIAKQLSQWNINAVFGGFRDSLMVEALHKEGIKIFAEVAIFTGTEVRWNESPELRPINAAGKPVQKDEWYCGIVPTVPWFHERKTAIIKKIMSTYDIDGIWLDFIRWPCHWEVPEPRLEQTSFDKISLETFQSDTKINIPNALQNPNEIAEWILTNHREVWTRWKCSVINEYVRELRDVVKSYGSEKLVGLFGVPWRHSDFNDAILRIIGQDYRELGGIVDVISPMVYHRMCGRDVEWISEIISHIHQETQGTSIWPVIQAMSEPDVLTPEEFGSAMKTALQNKDSNGLIIFTLDTVIKEKKLEVMKEIFSTATLQ